MFFVIPFIVVDDVDVVVDIKGCSEKSKN